MKEVDEVGKGRGEEGGRTQGRRGRQRNALGRKGRLHSLQTGHSLASKARAMEAFLLQSLHTKQISIMPSHHNQLLMGALLKSWANLWKTIGRER
jgi:hypothetical protein